MKNPYTAYNTNFKALISERIETLTFMEDQQQAKEIIEGCLLKIVEESERRYHSLEKRIYDEVCAYAKTLAIGILVAKKDKTETEGFFPIQPLGQDAWDKESICSTQAIFLEADTMVCKELIRQKRVFCGMVRTAAGEFSAKFVLARSGYQNAVEDLYHAVVTSGRQWSTVNSGYLQKFLRLEIVWTDPALQENESVERVTVDWEEYADRVRDDVQPLWNVQKLRMKSNNFAVPCVDRIHFEHELLLLDEAAASDYLVCPEQNVVSLRREKNRLIVTTDREKLQELAVLKIVPLSSGCEKAHVMLSNAMTESPVDGLQSLHGARGLSKAELVRKIHRLGMADYLELCDFAVLDDASLRGDSYDMNPFIGGETYVDDKKVLQLLFREKNCPKYLERDVLSYMVSQIQLGIREYRCVGSMR